MFQFFVTAFDFDLDGLSLTDEVRIIFVFVATRHFPSPNSKKLKGTYDD